MAGSESTGGSGDEQGTLISFPRSKWVPDDGIQPLDTGNGHDAGRDGDPPVVDEVGESIAPDSRSPAIEATDFWASGETQEFVGVASAPTGSAAPSAAGSTQLRHWLAGPQLLVASAAAVLIAIAGVAAWQLSGSAGGGTKRSAVLAASRHGRPPATYAAASHRNTARVHTIKAQLHRPRSLSHPKAHVRHQPKAVHHGTVTPQIVPVSYQQPASTNSAANTSNGYSPAVSGSSPQSTPATTASTSGGSGSSVSSSPPQPGPNGALTCISNCG